MCVDCSGVWDEISLRSLVLVLMADPCLLADSAEVTRHGTCTDCLMYTLAGLVAESLGLIVLLIVDELGGDLEVF